MDRTPGRIRSRQMPCLLVQGRLIRFILILQGRVIQRRLRTPLDPSHSRRVLKDCVVRVENISTVRRAPIVKRVTRDVKELGVEVQVVGRARVPRDLHGVNIHPNPEEPLSSAWDVCVILEAIILQREEHRVNHVMRARPFLMGRTQEERRVHQKWIRYAVQSHVTPDTISEHRITRVNHAPHVLPDLNTRRGRVAEITTGRAAIVRHVLPDLNTRRGRVVEVTTERVQIVRCV